MKKRRKQEPEAVREIMEEGPSFTDPQGRTRTIFDEYL